MSFIHDTFLLGTQTAQRLFHKFARISRSSTTTATCRRKMWPRTGGSRISSKSGWRAITTNGGRCGRMAFRSASAPATPTRTRSSSRGRDRSSSLRNPLYHWTHLELKRYFGIDELLDEQSPPAIWDTANEELTAPASARRHPREVPCQRALHHGRSRRRCASRAVAESGLATQFFPPSVPTRLDPINRKCSTHGWTSWRCRRRPYREVRRSARRARQTA